MNVGVGECIVGGSEGGVQGGYYARNAATVNLAISANGSGNPRIDTVVVTISDGGYTEPTGGSGNQVAAQVITGTPTTGATLSNLSGAGAVPASSLLLGYVLAPNGFSNIITADIANVATQAVSQFQPLNPHGVEWSYTQMTSVVNVNSTTESSPTTLLSPAAFTPDGAPVLVEFFAPYDVIASNGFVIVSLYEGATQISRLSIAYAQVASTTSGQSIVGRYRFTPTAASHTYTVGAYANVTSIAQVGAGAGGTAGYPPAFVRFTKV